jgi:Family of unknown function (DUF6074)
MSYRACECVILPFPTVRRVGLIKNLAWQLATYGPEAGERVFARQLEQQRASMVRRGLPSDVIDRELQALETAVRAMRWQITLFGGDAA